MSRQKRLVVVEISVKLSGSTEDHNVPLQSRSVFDWYCANFRHLDQSLYGGKVLQLKRTRDGFMAQFLYEDRNKSAIRVFAEVLANPDDDGNYPIGTFDGQTMTYNKDFTRPRPTSNVGVFGRLRTLKLLRKH